MDTMKLWESVCITDPDITKKVDQQGGFTAICAQAQLKRATEIWGPYGEAWGMRNVVFGYQPPEKTEEMFIEAEFFCPVAYFQISSDTGYRKNGDSRKKLLTDATTKALSKLGFNSDVFEGKYDDNKYVQELREAKKGKAKPIDVPALQKKVDECNTVKDLENLWYTWPKNGPEQTALGDCVGIRRTELESNNG